MPVPDPARRRFLQSGAAIAAFAAVESRAATPAPRARLADVDHIVVLMKENRSFDHYFGTLAGVRGFGDPDAMTLADGRPVFEQPDSHHPDGRLLPFRLDTQRSSAQRLNDLNHSWGPPHRCWNGGAMDGWVRTHRGVDGDAGPLTMGYLTRADLPF
jgi:phospholipase C